MKHRLRASRWSRTTYYLLGLAVGVLAEALHVQLFHDIWGIL